MRISGVLFVLAKYHLLEILKKKIVATVKKKKEEEERIVPIKYVGPRSQELREEGKEESCEVMAVIAVV